MKVMPLIMRTHEAITMTASNKLKPSMRKAPEEANVFRAISMKKIVRKTKSILLSRLVSIEKN